MMFSCSRDTYYVSTGMEATIPILTMILYHEIMHNVQCQRRMRRLGVTDQAQMAQHLPVPCEHEPPAHAAQIRFFLALYRRGLLPTTLSADEIGDMHQTIEAWEALDQRRFCSWYEEQLRAGAHAPQRTDIIKEVK